MQSGSQLAAAHSSVISWEAARVTIHKGISAWLCVRVRKEKVKVSKRQIVDAIIRWWLIAKIAGKKVRKLFWLKSASNHAGLADQCRTVTNTIAMNSLALKNFKTWTLAWTSLLLKGHGSIYPRGVCTKLPLPCEITFFLFCFFAYQLKSCANASRSTDHRFNNESNVKCCYCCSSSSSSGTLDWAYAHWSHTYYTDAK